jgi:hypothetical protein
MSDSTFHSDEDNIRENPHLSDNGSDNGSDIQQGEDNINILRDPSTISCQVILFHGLYEEGKSRRGRPGLKPSEEVFQVRRETTLAAITHRIASILPRRYQWDSVSQPIRWSAQENQRSSLSLSPDDNADPFSQFLAKYKASRLRNMSEFRIFLFIYGIWEDAPNSRRTVRRLGTLHRNRM